MPDASAQELPYDALVIALGSRTNYHGVPGATEHATPFWDAGDASSAASALRRLAYTARTSPVSVAIVVGGIVGVEVAAHASARLGANGRVTILHSGDALMASATARNANAGVAALTKAGVEVRMGVRVTEVKENEVVIDGGESVRADLILWTAGVVPALPPGLSTLECDGSGRILVDSALVAEENVFAAGDCAAIRGGGAMPPTAQAAYQAAGTVAANVKASLAGEGGQLKDFEYQDLGELVSLGDAGAAADVFGQVGISGEIAATARRGVYAARHPDVLASSARVLAGGPAAIARMFGRGR